MGFLPELRIFNLACGTKFLACVRNRRKGHVGRLNARVIRLLSTAQHIAPAVEYEVPPRDHAVRQLSGILSVFGFIFSSPGLDGAGGPVMEYRWL
jgi:hypothetical protein